MVMRVVCTYFFFFFKQKTAYECRISDWSSDVCSSDLCSAVSTQISVIRISSSWLIGWIASRTRCRASRAEAMRRFWRMTSCTARTPSPLGDRKSVVEGKSESVRVDLGGRRIIKKKKKKNYKQ